MQEASDVFASCWSMPHSAREACTCRTAGGIGSQAAAETGPDHAQEAFCRSGATAGCERLFRSLETVLTFGEAEGLVLIYFRNFPDERYSGLLERLLRQCAGRDWHPAPTATARIRQDRTAPASAPSKPLGKASGARP